MKIREWHEYGCARHTFPDLECGCWGGPFVTEDEAVRTVGRECQHPVASLLKTPTGIVCSCGAAVAIAEEG